MGLVSAKLRRKFSSKKKLVFWEEIKAITSQSQSLMETIRTPDRLKGYDPLHAIHITIQNLVSVFAEQISNLPELKLYYKKMSKAENQFIPSFPPMSPITNSYFTMWAFNDFRFGKEKESIASILLDLSNILNVSHDWIQIIEVQFQSRMGIYEHCGFREDKILLKEFITGKEWRCICPAGYKGKKGELWYVRILGSPYSLLDYGVIFTTPYLLRGYTQKQWIEYFERNGITGNSPDALLKFNTFMKHGKSAFYWHEFIGNGYDGYQKEVIYLRGIPDIPITLPHGGMYEN